MRTLIFAALLAASAVYLLDWLIVFTSEPPRSVVCDGGMEDVEDKIDRWQERVTG
jgi:hypothetical protein